MVLCVGRVEKRKNFRAAAESVRGLPLDLVIAGRSSDDSRALERYIRKHELTNVYLVGEVSEDERLTLLGRARAIVIPSFIEGIPYIGLEGILAGKHVICTENCYADSIPGFTLVPPKASAIRAALLALPGEARLPLIRSKELNQETMDSFLFVVRECMASRNHIETGGLYS